MDYQPINIDGSVLEGGGQILRMSVALSAICGLAIKVTQIRAGRSKPGLAAQHLRGIELVRNMCNGKLKGGQIGSTAIEFIPGKIKGGEYYADTQTAGSISLLLQVALPSALFASGPIKLQLKGGTNAEMAPQIDYMSEVFRPNLEKFGATFDLDLHKRGYFPKGGGHVTINVSPVQSLKAINVTTPGVPKCLHGWSYVAGTLPIRMSHQMADGAKNSLKKVLGDKVSLDIECYKESPDIAMNNANGIILVCETTNNCIIGGSGLGKRGIEPFSVGSSAAQEIIDALTAGACFDDHTQDQLIIFMALAEGTSEVRVGPLTMHTKTAIHVVETMTKVKFIIKEEQNTTILSCTGLGVINKH